MAPPHVIVVPSIASGHAIPVLRFARRLAATGIVTTVVTSDRHVLELENTLGSSDLSSQGEPLRLLGLRDRKSLDLSHDEWKQLVRGSREETEAVVALLQAVATDVASEQSQQLRGVAAAGAPVCILHDMFVPWAPEAAEKLGIQKHLLYVSGAISLSVDLQYPRLLQEGLVPITKETRDLVISGIPGLPPFPALDLPSPYLNASMLEWMRKFYATYRRADVILVNSFYDVEKPVLDALRKEVLGAPNDVQVCTASPPWYSCPKFTNGGVHSTEQATQILEIGPLLPESYVNENVVPEEAEERDPCIIWLENQSPNSVVYISFGSFATHSAPQLLELALGLEASGCCFLWLLRPPDAPGISAASGSPESVTEFLPPGFEERVNGRGMCYSGWAPQPRILKHPAVVGFLSHCGWNSTLEAVCAGVPVLAWPISAEQHLNRRLLVEVVKVAMELKGNPYTKEDLERDVRPKLFVSKEEIELKIRSLMLGTEGQFVRNNMQTLRAKSRDAGALGGSSRRSFYAYVHLLYDMQLSQEQ